ncbi:FecR family protein [Larkinella arboricola]
MRPEEFQELLHKYREGRCTPEEVRQLDLWYKKLSTQKEWTLTEAEEAQVKARLWNRIDEKTTPATTRPLNPWTNYRLYMALAASVVLVSVGYWVWLRSSTSQRQPESRFEAAGSYKKVNTTTHIESLTLADGSVVNLYPQSSIAYSRMENSKKREVWLTGSAFFNVHKDSQRPFFVYSGSVVTQVLGTSFWVKAPEGSKAIEVAVRTGRVSVFEQNAAIRRKNDQQAANQSTGVVLTPNQKATFFSTNNHWVTGLVTQPELVGATPAVTNQRFTYEEATLDEVLAELGKAYGIEMVIGNDGLHTCTFTGDLSKQPLYTKLDLICQSINAQYEVRGTRILINGSGCTP